jgi:LPS-assembly lipoprotein
MWWSRTFAAALLASALCACGFQPLYGERQGASATDELAAVHIDTISDRSGQILYNYLLDGMNPLGRPSSPDYNLKISLTEDSEGLALRSDETATRVNLTLTATFALIAAAAKDPAFKGVSRVTASYNILNSPYATLISQEDARTRALRDIARDIQNRLAVFLTRQAEAN